MTAELRWGALALVAAFAAGCATQPASTPAPAPKAASGQSTAAPAAAPAAAAPAAAQRVDLFMVLPETGRVHAFGDTKNYFDFLAHGEVQLTRTVVGGGPGGKTLVIGITNADVKSGKPSRAEQILAGAVTGSFYGEAFKDGRYYLFGDLKDMREFATSGEVPYSFTDIGVGPKGETIVFVMNKDSIKQGKPLDRLERFKTLRAQAPK